MAARTGLFSGSMAALGGAAFVLGSNGFTFENCMPRAALAEVLREGASAWPS